MLLLRPAQVKFSFCFFSKKALDYYFYLFLYFFIVISKTYFLQFVIEKEKR